MSGPGPTERKALARQYREARRPMGVYRICHKPSGRWLVGAATDVPAMLNRQRFQLEAGSHPNAALQREWRRDGAGAFEFETLDLLAPTDRVNDDPRPDLRALESLWRERLRELYGAGYAEELTSGL